MDLDTAIGMARSTTQSVLVTLRGNGRPQLSNVLHSVGGDGLIRISTTAPRAKTKNVAREPWAALHVNGADFFAYAVLEGTVQLSPVATHPDDTAVDELVELYRALAGEHENWADYRAAMVAEQRLVIRFSATRAYGMLRLPPPSGAAVA
jgi:PPOX class probable F420-dependent enzyme